MNIGAIVMIVMGTVGFAAMIAAALWGSRYTDDLNKKLSALLDNPVMTPKYYGISYISGTYNGHSVTLEWSPPRYNSCPAVLVYVKIHDLNIPALETNYRSDLPDKQSDTANLWLELSKLHSVQEIKFADHTLQIEMQWFTSPIDKKSGMLLAGTIADSLRSTDTAHITQEVGAALDNVLKILELLS